MQTTTEDFIPILFKVLFGFVSLNIVVNFILLYTRKMRMYKLLAIFWPAVLFVFVIQGTFQTGNLAVSMAYSASLISMSLFAMIGLEAIGRKFPWKKYILYFISFYPLTYLLAYMGFDFTAVAMPFAIATATPLLHAFIYIHIIDRKTTTRLQKVLGWVLLLMAVHCINFALFRMDPGAQLWGWLVAYAIYDMLAILLPSIALEQFNLNENGRLQKLVDERTWELNKSLKTNDSLLKVLIHDISNPLTVMKGYLHIFKKHDENKDFLIEGIQKSQMVMEEIIVQVRSNYLHKSRVKLEPVAMESCFKELSLIFEKSLKEKDVTLKFNNQLSSTTFVLANHVSLTHSVLSNLISNGIKFNPPHSEIEITAKEQNEKIVLEVKDSGPGIPQNIIQDIMQNKELYSTDGTSGEKGSGLGLSIVKSFVDAYGGQIEIYPNSTHPRTDAQGTNIRITLNRA